MKLGATWIDATAFDQNREQIAAWGDALSAEADLLFYGCDLAVSAAGRALLENFSAVTGADIEASTDDTGSAALGANWTLEYRLGDATTGIAFTQSVTSTWSGVLAAFAVTNTNDSGAGSLRAAITSANGLAGTDTITFSIAGAGPHTINLATVLPSITGTVILDGWTEPDYAGEPVIELNGAAIAAAGTDGVSLTATASGSTIRGLIINRFTGNGINIAGTGNTIVGNWIGTDATGTAAAANGSDGIAVKADNNTIGGTTAAERNVTSGNSGQGIDIDPGVNGTIVRGNYIGTNATGTAGIANGSGGIIVENSASTTIGGAATGEGNVMLTTRATASL